MTALAGLLAARIARTGPMRVADFMAECLWHPRHGYYATRPGIGSRDFTTAPEISQMFGELVGLSLASAWTAQGSPQRFVLAELGPGRGVLMGDALRAAARVPGFAEAAELHLVEASAVLRAEQAARLPGATFHDSLTSLPEAPLYLIANEFFDALPIRQFVRAGAGWAERLVGLSGQALAFGLAPPTTRPGLAERLQDTGDGDVVETCPAGAAIAAEIGRRIAAQGGAALIVDYGDWHSLGDTLQAVAAGAMVDPLETPGAADLTAHVDFEALAQAAAPARHSRLTPQGVFLDRLGIGARAEALAARAESRDAIVAAHRRLTHPGEMGHLFKVIGLFGDGAAPPPGLET